jgi:CheY-like chemotaxis protein
MNYGRILVVDDNRDSAESLARLLQVCGNETLTAFDGLEALEVGSQFRPNVVLLDLGMPNLNGYDTARRIRQQPWGQNAVLIALTGWGKDEDRRRSGEAGFDSHVVKPVVVEQLDALLASLVSR